MAYVVGEGEVSIGADFTRAYQDLGKFTEQVARNLNQTGRGFTQIGQQARSSLQPMVRTTQQVSEGFRDAERSGSRMAQAVQTGMIGAGRQVFRLTNLVKGGLAFAFGNILAGGIFQSLTNMKAFVQETIIGTARVKQMETVLGVLGRRQGFTAEDTKRLTDDIRAMGIETGIAQNTLQEFIRYNLDLEQASKVARVAQDAAVLSNSNSSETLQRVIIGISRQNSLILRNAGLQVQVGQAIDKYAQSLGKAGDELNSYERTQAVLNAVLEEGEKIQGAYEASLTEPLKKLGSLVRIVDDLQGNLGERLYPAFKLIVNEGVDPFVKGIEKATRAGEPLNETVSKVGIAIEQLAGSFLDFFTDRVVTDSGPKRYLKEQWQPLADAFTEGVDIVGDLAASFLDLASFLGQGLIGNGLRAVNAVLEVTTKLFGDASLAINAFFAAKLQPRAIIAAFGEIKTGIQLAALEVRGLGEGVALSTRLMNGLKLAATGLKLAFKALLPIAVLTIGLELIQKITEKQAEFRQYTSDVRDLLGQSFESTEDMLEALESFLAGGREADAELNALVRLSEFDDREGFLRAFRTGKVDVDELADSLRTAQNALGRLYGDTAFDRTVGFIPNAEEIVSEISRIANISTDTRAGRVELANWIGNLIGYTEDLGNRLSVVEPQLREALTNLSLDQGGDPLRRTIFGTLRDELFEIGRIDLASLAAPGVDDILTAFETLAGAGFDPSKLYGDAATAAREWGEAQAEAGGEAFAAEQAAGALEEAQEGLGEQTRLTTEQLAQQRRELEKQQKAQLYTDIKESVLGLFDAFSEAPEQIKISGAELIRNLDEQLALADSFYADLAVLSEAGLENVVSLLGSKGVEAASVTDELANDLDLAKKVEDKLAESEGFAGGIAKVLVEEIEGPDRQKVVDAFRKYGSDSYQAYQEGFGLVVDDKSGLGNVAEEVTKNFGDDVGQRFIEQGIADADLDAFFNKSGLTAKAEEAATETTETFGSKMSDGLSAQVPSAVTSGLTAPAVLGAAASAGERIGDEAAIAAARRIQSRLSGISFDVPTPPGRNRNSRNVFDYDIGGNIPGVRGTPTMIGAHAGEVVIPSHRKPIEDILAEAMAKAGAKSGGGGGNTYHIHQPVVSDEPTMAARALAETETTYWLEGF